MLDHLGRNLFLGILVRLGRFDDYEIKPRLNPPDSPEPAQNCQLLIGKETMFFGRKITSR